MDLRFLLLLVCFFVSGFAALLYQTAWTREFAFLFGTSELAVVAVLAAYMGGLAFGAAVAARFAGRLARPVLAYGLLELGIGLGALAVPFLIHGVQSTYLALAGGLDAPPEAMALTTALFHLAGSFAVLLPCTALMGATLPLLARHAVSSEAQIGPRIGILYAVNTAGAIAGTLVAAFLLLPALGLRDTVHVGIAGNFVVFAAASLLARSSAATDVANTSSRDGSARIFHWILPAMTVSGAVSFLYEVLWTRLLGQVLGGSTAAFASMLSSFLLGIALGSALAARLARTRAAAARGFAVAQLGSGLSAYFAFRAADSLPTLTLAVGASPSSPAAGAAAAGILLLPVTLCIGATFPFAVRMLSRSADEAASVSGRVYAWNTVGSIFGAIATGFFLLPGLGLERTALVGVVTSLVLAFATAWSAMPRQRALAGAAAAMLVGALAIGLPVPVELLLHTAISGTRTEGKLVYLGVGRSATVTVVEYAQGWRLFTNGLPESGVERREVPDLRFDESAWLSLLPTAVRPETKKMLIIGLGAGKTLGATAATVSSIDLIELEEEVVRANRWIPRAIDPLDDPRVTLHLGDARGAMNLSDKRYDAIVSQPSHPFTSGASHLYTREFFELAHSKLTPGGVFVQWIGAGFVDLELFGSLMAAMTAVFPHVHVYRPVPVALVFVASDEPIDLLESGPRALAAAPSDFARHGIDRLEDLYASWSMDTQGVRAFSEGRPPNTDDHNRLAAARAPVGDRLKDLERFNEQLGHWDALTPERLAAVEATAVLERMTWNGELARAYRLAAALPGADRFAAEGWIAYDHGQMQRANALLRRALALDPDHRGARAGLIAVYQGHVLDPVSLAPDERAVLAANDRLGRSDWEGLRALDEELKTIAPGALLFGSAARARAAWRLEIGDEAAGLEAIEIVDELLTRYRSPDHYSMRAKAGAQIGDFAIAWAALDAVANHQQVRPQLATFALALARSLPPPPTESTTLEHLEQLARPRPGGPLPPGQ